ncbi:hypothetical protein MLD38_032971 [Melastoma candidum]|uniref:Uncharacterized protein n=1 Tax=Melastoma candidum TaxID=119954 RepID=A0ACB9M7C4_9MYRT|nr:hypothetical protein MLD38_032971 [Melastoma candidum]
MERQRSFSLSLSLPLKSTLLLTFFSLLASSLLIFFSFSFWIFTSTPTLILQQTHLHFNSTPTTPLTVQTLPGLVEPADRTDSSSKDSILIGALFEERGNATGSVEWTVLQQVPEEEEDEGKEDDDDEVQERMADAVTAANDTVPLEIREEAVKESGRCDLMNGSWVYDEGYPLYTNATCPYIDEGFDCDGNGRKDKSYMKLRWRPHTCEMPRFNATSMLQMMRGKRVVFVGDSINRNQWESLLCMLLGGVKDRSRVYETRGRKITKEKGNYSFRFVDYMCTVEFYVSHFLVHEGKVRIGQKRVQTLRIDKIDHGSSRWRGADIVVFNTGSWWSHYKTKAGINYYQEGSMVHPRLDVSTAFRKALITWASWVDSRINPRKTRVFFRSISPSHFRGGQWNSGGHCGEATQPLDLPPSEEFHEKNAIIRDVIRRMRVPVEFLDITSLSEYRIDGHPSIYGGGGKSKRRQSSAIQDCSHWCLPGVPDTWNELLYVHLLGSRHR